MAKASSEGSAMTPKEMSELGDMLMHYYSKDLIARAYLCKMVVDVGIQMAKQYNIKLTQQQITKKAIDITKYKINLDWYYKNEYAIKRGAVAKQFYTSGFQDTTESIEDILEYYDDLANLDYSIVYSLFSSPEVEDVMKKFEYANARALIYFTELSSA